MGIKAGLRFRILYLAVLKFGLFALFMNSIRCEHVKSSILVYEQNEIYEDRYLQSVHYISFCCIMCLRGSKCFAPIITIKTLHLLELIIIKAIVCLWKEAREG